MNQTLILQLQYCGTSYQGWQRQQNTSETIEEHLLVAFSKVAPLLPLPPSLHCAGRTDKGVHAIGQIISLALPLSEKRKAYKWKEGLNTFLPSDIRVQQAFVYNKVFHARFEATSRHYYYLLHKSPSLFLEGLSTYLKDSVCLKALNDCAKLLVGEHDFQSFQGGSCQAQSSVKTMYEAHWFEKGDFLVFSIKGSGFLHHMVRYLVACQIQVAKGEKTQQWFSQLLKEKTSHHYCMESAGLYFYQASYPFELPFTPSHPLFELFHQ